MLSLGCNGLIAQGAGIAVSPEVILEELGAEPRNVQEGQKSEGLSREEREIVELLKEKAGTIEELCSAAGKKIPELSVLLVQLQLKGIVKEEGKNFYTLRG